MSGAFKFIPHTKIEVLAEKFLRDMLAKENYGPSSAKGGFLSGGNVLVCESRGLAEYVRKRCADESECRIWTAHNWKPLAGLLMQYGYNLSEAGKKKDEGDNPYNQSNLVWSIYRLLEGKQQTAWFASQLASLFAAYQIYRPDLIQAWNEGKAYRPKGGAEVGSNFAANEARQRELWQKIRSLHAGEQSVADLYQSLIATLEKGASSSFLPKQIFIFAPLSLAPVQIKTLGLLARAGCTVRLYLLVPSREYYSASLSDKKIARIRKESWKNDKTVEEGALASGGRLYWDIGNRLIANLGRTSQVLFEMIEALPGIDESEELIDGEDAFSTEELTLLQKVQRSIRSDSSEKVEAENDGSIVFNNCFSPLREIEALSDYLLGLFVNEKMSPAQIAVVSPDIEPFAAAIDSVFSRYQIPYRIADRDVKKSDKTAQLLSLILAQVGGRYAAPDIMALFELSRLVQDEMFETADRERIEKWINENAVRRGLESQSPAPNYTFQAGLAQMAAGFFMIAPGGFSEQGEYCYDEIEGSSAQILGAFADFFEALCRLEQESKTKKTIEGWDALFRDVMPAFFGPDKTDYTDEDATPCQKVFEAWDNLKKSMLIGFRKDEKQLLDFAAIKSALPQSLESGAKSSYSESGAVSFANIETLRASPRKVICFIGMNGGAFPRQPLVRDMSLMQPYRPGDKDSADEDRMMFLETFLAAREKIYISWVGQSEKTAEELDASSAVLMLLENLGKQFGLEEKTLVAKHPLQPFSHKYGSGGLATYDKRWVSSGLEQMSLNGTGIWDWRIEKKSGGIEDINKKSQNDLYRILSNVPKYFLKDVCGITLPEDEDVLSDREPFYFENGIENYIFRDLILTSDDYEKEIAVGKMQGSIPAGTFAQRSIDAEAAAMLELKAKADGAGVPNLYFPSKENGKKILKHLLFHLHTNAEKSEGQETLLFLRNATNRLAGISQKEAQEKLEELWGIVDELQTRMLPIFIDAAWKHAFGSTKGGEAKRLIAAWNAMYDSPYLNKVVGKATAFSELYKTGEEDFVRYTGILFDSYQEMKANPR